MLSVFTLGLIELNIKLLFLKLGGYDISITF